MKDQHASAGNSFAAEALQANLAALFSSAVCRGLDSITRGHSALRQIKRRHPI
jgi:hypothetical protein